MARFLKSRLKSLNKPPGALEYISSESAPMQTEISFLEYSAESVDEKNDCDVSAIKSGSKNVRWLDVRGLADKSALQDVATIYDIPSLWIEDILNTDHRPKMEDMDSCLFSVTRFPTLDSDSFKVSFEQVSLVLKEKNLVTFQEDSSTDTLSTVKERIRAGKGRIRKLPSIYLFYSLIDIVVDRYFLVLEKIGKKIEDAELLVEESQSADQIKELVKLRQELLYLRKSALPLRDSIQQIYNLPIVADDPEIRPFFRDVLDHSAQVVEVIESYREMAVTLVQYVQSLQGQKMNEIMTFLTIFASIFIPLTFIVGVYGTNFEYLPEIKWKSGYFVMWGVMAAIALGMLAWFRKKKWI